MNTAQCTKQLMKVGPALHHNISISPCLKASSIDEFKMK